MGDRSAIAFPFFLRFVYRNRAKTRKRGCAGAASRVPVSQPQPQPPQVEQLPVQEAEGSCTAIGSPPFIAALMMASI